LSFALKEIIIIFKENKLKSELSLILTIIVPENITFFSKLKTFS